MKEEVKRLRALENMKNMIEMNRLQKDSQQLREKDIEFNNMLQPYQEQIAKLVDTVEKKVKEFTTRKSVIDSTEDPMISQVMLEVAQDCVKAMDKYSQGLRRKPRRSYRKRNQMLVTRG